MMTDEINAMYVYSLAI